MTDILHPDDPRATSENMKTAIVEHVEDLIKSSVFKFIWKQMVPYKADILSWKSDLAIKAEGDVDEQYKVRLVIGRNREKQEFYMVWSQTAQPSSTRIFLACSEMHNFEFWLDDVKQVYLQAKGKIDHDVHIFNVPPEFNVKNG